MRACVRWMVTVVCAFAAGCGPKATDTYEAPRAPEYSRPLPPGRLALRRLTDLTQLPDFTKACADLPGLRESIAASLNYLAKPSALQHFPYGPITHADAVESLEAFDALIASGASGEQLNAAIRQRFDVYTSVGWNGRGGVLFTAYYTPIFDASAVRTDYYRYPLYRPPEGLTKGPAGQILGVRLFDGTINLLPERRYLELSGLLDGRELVYLSDPFEAYIAHVQGSARLRMPDGNLTTVGYAASNGREYRSVAKALVDDKRIRADQISLQAMIEFFADNPDLVDNYVKRNPRYIFFQRTHDRPRGSLNEPVTPMRTIATDKTVYPRACLAFVQAALPRRVGDRVVALPYEGFALDQDTGGAIRAPGRCDIYIGVGDEAGDLAGRTQTEGRLYYLFLKGKPTDSP